ncbi:MAG: hypothetical protein B6D46_07395 [Polyangiaceae bacterium UTPRO1]|jgi:hypothetical protein|nr:hypothetical protein [Myxococcales bacterium]OQY67302.1 MAG: hypothetical protein B6D46_07395 [Polyangiaceae bacterium UTPRO1]
MAQPEESSVITSAESLIADKEAMAAREKNPIEDLNAALKKMGYRVVPIKSASGTGAASTGKKRGRPPGSDKTQTAKSPIAL